MVIDRSIDRMFHCGRRRISFFLLVFMFFFLFLVSVGLQLDTLVARRLLLASDKGEKKG